MVHNFGFLEGGNLAGCAHLGGGRTLRENLQELARDHHITAVVTLSEDALSASALEEHGVKCFHLPVRDFGVPSLKQMAAAVDFVTAELAAGGRVVAHCGAGYGRTGTFLACCLVAQGVEPSAAIRQVRQSRPGSIENSQQEDFVLHWADWMKKSRGRS